MKNVLFVVELGFDFVLTKIRCVSFVSKKAISVSDSYNLPVWYDSQKTIYYELPEELKDLHIGEQMMIQRLSLYIPIQYLRFQQTCCSGHVCAFPQDVKTICNICQGCQKW